VAKYVVMLHNRLPCNLNPTVKVFVVQLGHQDGNGNLIRVEDLRSEPNIGCDMSTELQSADEDPNIGIVSILCNVNIAGKDTLLNGRVDTDKPGKPLSSPLEAELAYDFSFEITRGDTDPDKVAQTRSHSGKIRFRV
jgi:hypothetical protein